MTSAMHWAERWRYGITDLAPDAGKRLMLREDETRGKSMSRPPLSDRDPAHYVSWDVPVERSERGG